METNKATHTPEPWTESAKEIDGEPTDANYRSIKAGCGYYDEGDELKGFELTGWISPEYSARIVACVNACAGIANPNAIIPTIDRLKKERSVLFDELEHIRNYIEADENESTFDEVVRRTTILKKQRDELLAALKSIEPYMDSIVCYASTIEEHKQNGIVKLVREAIANAEKGVGK
jgi:hypothetical protein